MKPPNIVYILADDMGYGDLSCLNPESKIRTEQLDRLAAGGLICRDAHASSAVCTPSRYSILTGRYNWRSELKDGVQWGYSPHLIEDGRMTVASFLKAHGYHTGCFGKWHLGLDWQLPEGGPAINMAWQDRSQIFEPDPDPVDYTRPALNGPTTAGFDTFFGIPASLDMPPFVYVEDDRATAVPDHYDPGRKGKQIWRAGWTAPDFRHEQVLDRVAERVVRYIESRAAEDKPFFAYFPLSAPHTPILPAAQFQGTSGTNEYGDFCLHVDHVVGRVMDTLERCGFAENTIVVFTSDNGCSPMADFAELAAVGHHPSYHFRGHKADIYEGGHRIPLLVRWPDRIAAGRVTDQTVCLSDLLATCADILGDPLPGNAGEDSVSNLPVWLGEDGGSPVREATVHHSIDGSFSIRQGRWKLELCPGSGGWSDPRPGEEPEGAPPIQLYDLEADVGERRNAQDEQPEVVRDLTALLARYVREGRSTPGAPQPNTGPRHWPQLNWLKEEGP